MCKALFKQQKWHHVYAEELATSRETDSVGGSGTTYQFHGHNAI